MQNRHEAFGVQVETAVPEAVTGTALDETTLDYPGGRLGTYAWGILVEPDSPLVSAPDARVVLLVASHPMTPPTCVPGEAVTAQGYLATVELTDRGQDVTLVFNDLDFPDRAATLAIGTVRNNSGVFVEVDFHTVFPSNQVLDDDLIDRFPLGCEVLVTTRESKRSSGAGHFDVRLHRIDEVPTLAALSAVELAAAWLLAPVENPWTDDLDALVAMARVVCQ